jgi:HipA-like protein
MDVLSAERISAAGRRGSSRPLIVETDAGARIVKLRGAAQGTGPLVAEVIVGELAEALGLAVPPRSLVDLPAEIETADWDDELAQLLAASVGLNLGFDFLAGAREFGQPDVARVAPELRAGILWFDRLVLNPDRTARNPNLLWWADHLWLIDHGAALGFQYDWQRVLEQSPRDARLPAEAHLFESLVPPDDLRSADEELGSRLTRDVIDAAVAAVPESFLMPLVDAGSAEPRETTSRIARRRAAYGAFLWKRVQQPRPFLDARPLPAERSHPPRPPWLTGR